MPSESSCDVKNNKIVQYSSLIFWGNVGQGYFDNRDFFIFVIFWFNLAVSHKIPQDSAEVFTNY